MCSTVQMDASVGVNSPYDRRNVMNRSEEEKRHHNVSKSGDQRLSALYYRMCYHLFDYYTQWFL